MGLRSWLTKVDDVWDYVSLCAQVRHNPLAFGIFCRIKITEECPLERGVWVAWSGDGQSSLCEFMSPYFESRTRILDNVVDDCPDYNADPSQYGQFAESEGDVIRWLVQQEGCGDEDICTRMEDDMSFVTECNAALKKRAKVRLT